jgi:putative hydrolase of the HAD superfamily
VSLKAILFDLDDTLMVDEAVSRQTMAEVAGLAAEKYGVSPIPYAIDASSHAKRLYATGPAHDYCRAIGISAFECLWGKFEGDGEDLTRLREWCPKFRSQVFNAALHDQEVEAGEGVQELAEYFASTRRRLQKLMPDAEEVVRRLKSDYKIGLLTNGAPDLQREKIAASGLEKYFDAIVVSGELGIGKPKPEIFLHLLEKLDVTVNQAVMVGNSLERDIAGARNAGLAISIWIKVSGAEEEADAVPTYRISYLSELLSLLARDPSGQ